MAIVQMLLIILTIFILSAAYQSDETKMPSSIIFPVIDEFPEKCNLSDGTPGTCRNLKYCPTALTAQTIDTCYFIHFEHYVCCRDNIESNIPDRLILRDCYEMLSKVYITHGKPTRYREYPYMVALGWDSILEPSTYDYKCGGVLISNQYILTAAHCTKLNGVEPSVALVGGANLTDTSIKPLKIEKVIPHPGYKRNETYHDIALIKLAELSSESGICLWSWFVLDDVNVTAIGYGHTEFGGLSSMSLLKAQLTVIGNDGCNKSYINESTLPQGIVQTQLCAQDPENLRDTCQGDSGGPLILHSTGRSGFNTPFIVGITSFGKGCAFDSPGIYTRVSEYVDWIDNIIFPS